MVSTISTTKTVRLRLQTHNPEGTIPSTIASFSIILFVLKFKAVDGGDGWPQALNKSPKYKLSRIQMPQFHLNTNMDVKNTNLLVVCFEWPFPSLSRLVIQPFKPSPPKLGLWSLSALQDLPQSWDSLSNDFLNGRLIKGLETKKVLFLRRKLVRKLCFLTKLCHFASPPLGHEITFVTTGICASPPTSVDTGLLPPGTSTLAPCSRSHEETFQPKQWRDWRDIQWKGHLEQHDILMASFWRNCKTSPWECSTSNVTRNFPVLHRSQASKASPLARRAHIWRDVREMGWVMLIQSVKHGRFSKKGNTVMLTVD